MQYGDIGAMSLVANVPLSVADYFHFFLQSFFFGWLAIAAFFLLVGLQRFKCPIHTHCRHAHWRFLH